MKSRKTFIRNVWREKRKKLTMTIHLDLENIIRQISKEKNLPMSVVIDEVLFEGLKKIGWIN